MILFVAAVITIVGTLSAVTWYVTETFITPRSVLLANPAWYSRPSFEYSCYVGLGSAVLIFGGSLFKIFELRRGGGKLVAESLGGKRISPSSAKGDERKLMNIVEEMAIASGVPVPPVFLMNEDGINAFAAGYSPKDAVLGVTRGCISKLNRSELQGVIAHEFSHILNGDMRMNIKLMGFLHGILLIGLTGHMILRGLFHSGGSRSRRSSKDNEGGGGGILVIAAIAVAAIIVGFIGVFFGNLIKAAVSRQREFLADASAVQFTRDPGNLWSPSKNRRLLQWLTPGELQCFRSQPYVLLASTSARTEWITGNPPAPGDANSGDRSTLGRKVLTRLQSNRSRTRASPPRRVSPRDLPAPR